MSSLLLTGWLLAVCSAVLLLLARRAAARSTECVVRACHELRGPLQNVMLVLGTTDEQVADRPPFRALAVELTRATRAVEDLAAATAGRRTRDEVRRIDLLPLVGDLVAVHDVAARARGRRVQLVTPDAHATVIGDRDRLTQAIGNLVRNAVEHGRGTVRVGIEHGTDRVHVEIADEGTGLRVPIDRLVHGPRRGRRGRGMRIVSEALAAHGGRLRSAPSGAGARMVAELPSAGPRAAVR